jgi:pimeloyl-ACP methyl ester carboxylesterase
MARIGTVGLIMLIMIGSFLGMMVILLGLLLAVSSGKTKPFLDETGRIIPGSISEKIHVNINGSQQGMFIKGRDVANPVLLFLHGGAGMPEYFLNQNYPNRLEDYFTVCWWDRCGAGLSYAVNVPQNAMTIEQYILDTLAVTHYLRTRFRKDKIFLMAHSGGSIIGIQAVAKVPELYAAYIGVGQISYQLKSEILACQYMIERYKEAGNSSMVRQLEAAPLSMTVPLPASYMRLRDKAMHELGIGTTHDMKSVMTGVFLASWVCRDYTLSEKLNIWRGKFSSDKRLFDKMIAMDMTKIVSRLDIPTYFFHGHYDYTVSYPETKAYFGMLEAPVKGFYTFEKSAHSPMFEEPARIREIIERDVLSGGNSLADRN